MKYLFHALLLAIVIQSCKSKTSQNTTDTTGVVTSTDQSNALIEKFKPIIQGIWVKQTYMDAVTKTSSPYSSFEYLRDMASFSIEADSIRKDTLPVGYSLNNHEGTEFTLYFIAGNKPNSLQTKLADYRNGGYYELGYLINTDTSLIVYHYNKQKRFTDSTIYKRILPRTMNKDSDAGEGIQEFVNRKLFLGKYVATDSLGHVLNVEFTNGGKTTGLPNFKTYYIATDFEAGPENNLDVVYFNISTKQQQMFAYKIKADTLTLLGTKENEDHTLLLPAKVRYRIVRKK